MAAEDQLECRILVTELHTTGPQGETYLSDVALIAESGILPDVIPTGLINLHSGSRTQVIGLGLMRI